MNLAEFLTIPAQIAEQQRVLSTGEHAMSYAELEATAAVLAAELRSR